MNTTVEGRGRQRSRPPIFHAQKVTSEHTVPVYAMQLEASPSDQDLGLVW